MNIVKHRKWFYSISLAIVVASIAFIGINGLNYGIDFTGGSILEIEYLGGEKMTLDEVNATIKETDESAFARPTGDTGYIIRMKEISNEQKSEMVSGLSLDGKYEITEKRFDSIGPVLGQEALKSSIMSIVLVLLAIIMFVSYAFRNVSEPVSSWKYGLIAILALVHDVIVPTGVFAVLGVTLGYEVDTLFVTALLVILGFSVHDTIVVFDRVREKLRFEGDKKPFEEIVEESVQSTMARSINTSLTTLLALLALYFVGGDVTKPFTLVLIIGIFAGTYSSVFLASPLLVTAEKMAKKAGKNKAK